MKLATVGILFCLGACVVGEPDDGVENADDPETTTIAAPSATFHFGYMDEFRYWANQDPQYGAATIPYAAEGGASFIRLTVDMAGGGIAWGDPYGSWSDIDWSLEYARQNNLRVLPVLLNSSGYDFSDADWGTFAYNALVHIAVYYGVGVEGVEVWNEPNLSYISGTTGLQFSCIPAEALLHYADIVDYAKLGIAFNHGRDTGKTILGGLYMGSQDGWNNCPNLGTDNNWRNYYASLAYWANPNYALAIHPYVHGGPSGAVAAVNEKISWAMQHAYWRNVHITEFGFSSSKGGWTEALQNERGMAVYQHARRSGAASFVWYRLNHFSGEQGGLYERFSAMRPDRSKKPIFRSLRDAPR